jgi:hypothetical protein
MYRSHLAPGLAVTALADSTELSPPTEAITAAFKTADGLQGLVAAVFPPLSTLVTVGGGGSRRCSHGPVIGRTGAG